jgi:hypothetical protein
MNRTYKIEEEGTNGWYLYDDQYQNLTKEQCMEFLDKLIAEGVNPNRLRAIRDDLPTKD